MSSRLEERRQAERAARRAEERAARARELAAAERRERERAALARATAATRRRDEARELERAHAAAERRRELVREQLREQVRAERREAAAREQLREQLAAERRERERREARERARIERRLAGPRPAKPPAPKRQETPKPKATPTSKPERPAARRVKAGPATRRPPSTPAPAKRTPAPPKQRPQVRAEDAERRRRAVRDASVADETVARRRAEERRRAAQEARRAALAEQRRREAGLRERVDERTREHRAQQLAEAQRRRREEGRGREKARASRDAVARELRAREEQHRAEERRRLDAKRPPTERTTKPEPKPRPPAVRRRDDKPRVRMPSPTQQELRERARQRAKEEERSVRRRSDAEARAAARRRDDTDVAAREAAKQQQLRAIARQATLEREAQARAREARVAGRRSALAAKQRDERTAERRKRVVPRQRLPNGVLSGSLAWLGARGPLLVDEFDQPVVLRGATARWFERAEPTGQAYAAPLDDDDLELLQEWGATAVTIPIAQNLALEGRGDATGTHYLEALDATVAAAAEAGLYTIVQLSLLSSVLPTHVGPTGRDEFDPPLPNNASLDLWGLLGRRYAREAAVIFDLFRSPHDPEPGDPTGALLPRLTWRVWRRWLLAMLGEVRRGHPRSIVVVRGLDRGRDSSGFPVAYTDGSRPANLVYGGELRGGDDDGVLAGLATLARSHPVGVFTWRAREGTAVEAFGRRLARSGHHWIAADWNQWQMPLVERRQGRLGPTRLGTSFRVALAQPAAPAANVFLGATGPKPPPEAIAPPPRTPPARDPFAPPGTAGNRWTRYGDNGPVPDRYRKKVDQAMELCYDLAAKPSFTALFSRVISTLTGREVGPEAYTEALDRIVVQLAETTKDPRIVEFMRHDVESVRIDPTYQPAPAFSVPTQPNVWIKESQLQRDARVIAGTLMHESAHVAGAPAHLPAEYLIEALHNAGYPRR